MIRTYFNSYHLFNEEEINQIEELSVKRSLNKLDFFMKENEICKEVGFIVSGSLRSFYTTPTGEEITYCIHFPQNVITAYSSFITGEASRENIQAITPVELLVFPKNLILELEAQSHHWTKFLKTIAEEQYIALEKRIFQLQKTSAKEKYMDLLTNHPEYIQQIPLQYLASYLGITQRHLSRIRKEITF